MPSIESCASLAALLPPLPMSLAANDPNPAIVIRLEARDGLSVLIENDALRRLSVLLNSIGLEFDMIVAPLLNSMPEPTV
jgi:hypothetical protein